MKVNEKFSNQVVQSNMEKKNLDKTNVDLLKRNSDLESGFKQCQNKEAELNLGLEHMKKLVKMLHSSS